MSDKALPFEVLAYLMYIKEANEKEITDFVAESEEDKKRIKKALNRFVEKEILIESNGIYELGPKFESFFMKLSEMYEEVRKKPQRGKSIRGILSLLQRYYLLNSDFVIKIAKEKGFEKEDIENFLKDEIERGLIRRIKIVSNKPLSDTIHYRIYRRMRSLDEDELKRLIEEWKAKGLDIYEKHFFVSMYPSGLAESSKEYVKGIKELMEKVKEELPAFLI